MSELFLLVLGACSFVYLTYTVVSWVLPAASVGGWTEENEKAKKNGWSSIKCRPHKESRVFSIVLVMFFIVAIAAYFLLLAYVVHLPRPP
jgi:hypothetical protein